MLILISFVLQAVSYEFRTKPGNIFGTRTYDTFLFINGCVGCILLGVAVSMFFFGAEFSVSKGNILDGSSPVISVWLPPTVSEVHIQLEEPAARLHRSLPCPHAGSTLSAQQQFQP